MTGPRVLAENVPDPEPVKHPDEGKTGIRRSQYGSWMAIVDGRCVGVWSGAGSKLRAIRNAGTNTVLA